MAALLGRSARTVGTCPMAGIGWHRKKIFGVVVLIVSQIMTLRMELITAKIKTTITNRNTWNLTMDNKYYSIGYFAVGKPKDKSYFANVFNSFADADYFIRNMRRSVKNFHYFVEACEVKVCAKCEGHGVTRVLGYEPEIDEHEIEVCSNCHGHGVIKA